ncbi:hypothetical protein BJF81_11585 [Ornithinimicrobium sp. CNJ-824]|nr:hypothetical protein BJF81_11585 [Ornithinimicrobium sp. CNJ-824]
MLAVLSSTEKSSMHLTTRLRRGLAAAAGTSLTLTGLVTLAPMAHAAGTTLVINEVYGGGGNSGATWTNDFVELFNGTDTEIDLTGYTVQYYSSAGGPGGSNNTCVLAGSVAPGDHFLTQQAAGSGGTQALPAPDATCGATMSGTNGIVRLFDTDGAVVDTVGYGSASIFEGTGTAPRLSNTTSASRTDGIDTDDNAADFTSGTPTPQNSGGGGEPEPPPEPVKATIAEIQGTGDTTPYLDQEVITTGVVTAVYPTGGFNGVYIQTPGTGGTAKVPGEDASDGIFVYNGYAGRTLEIGDCVDVEATAIEYNGLTELSDAWVEKIDGGCAPVTATPLDTLPATDAEKEVYEGMLVHPEGAYTITNNYQLNQYGQIGLAMGEEPLYQATDVVEPGPEAIAYEAMNEAKYITLDDGSSWDYLRNSTAQFSPLPYLAQDEPHRTASQVTFDQPVILDYRFQWNYQPPVRSSVPTVSTTRSSPRTTGSMSCPRSAATSSWAHSTCSTTSATSVRTSPVVTRTPTSTKTRSRRTGARSAAPTTRTASRTSRPRSSPPSTRWTPTSWASRRSRQTRPCPTRTCRVTPPWRPWSRR